MSAIPAMPVIAIAKKAAGVAKRAGAAMRAIAYLAITLIGVFAKQIAPFIKDPCYGGQ